MKTAVHVFNGMKVPGFLSVNFLLFIFNFLYFNGYLPAAGQFFVVYFFIIDYMYMMYVHVCMYVYV